MPILVVQSLSATPFEVGVVNAGVYIDRWRRQPVLVWASAGRALIVFAAAALTAALSPLREAPSPA
jgi:hypothetical protein